LFAICAGIAIGMFVAVFTKIEAFALAIEAVLGIALSVRAARASVIETHIDRRGFSAHSSHLFLVEG
jgi:hypothetical protein